MANFRYKSINNEGKYITGKLSAENPSDLMSLLKSSSLELVSYREEKNIAFGVNSQNINKKLLIESSKKARIYDEHKNKLYRFKSVIGENGVNDSKGDKKVIEVLDKKQNFMIKEATTFLKEAGFDIKYPIKIVKFHNPNILGQADDSIIYLSEKLFNMGKRKLAAVIIEENEHNSTGWGDETREFQSHFIDLYLSSLEDKVGIYL
jgi:hypothetical protein